MNKWLIHYKLSGLFTLMIAAYVYLIVVSASARPIFVRNNLSEVQILVLTLTVVIPYITVWVIGLAGYIWLSDYARSIRKAADGNALLQLSRGVLILLLWMPLTGLIRTFALVLAHGGSAHYASLVSHFGTYIGVALMLLTYFQLNEGAFKMLRAANIPYRVPPRRLAFAFLPLIGLYVYLVLRNPAFESGITTTPLPNWIIIDTIALPQLLAWYWGLLAIWRLYFYINKVKGKLYRLAFSYLATGLALVTATIIILQYLQALTDATQVTLKFMYLVVVALLVLIGAGFMLIVRGARALRRIEEI